MYICTYLPTYKQVSMRICQHVRSLPSPPPAPQVLRSRSWLSPQTSPFSDVWASCTLLTALTATVQQGNNYAFAEFIIKFGKNFPALQALADQVLNPSVWSKNCCL